MINRALLRIKIIQILYSYYKGDGKSLSIIEKEFFYSLDRTYDLYFHLLQLSVEITQYASERIDMKRNKLLPTEDELHPNTRFIDNRFILQLSKNKTLNDYLTKNKLSWVNHQDMIKTLYEDILEADFYTEYMNADADSYSNDKDIWRKIYKKIILQSEEFDSCIEDQSIYWVDDLELVLSFVLKTVKRFDLESGAFQELLPMFKDEEDRNFALKLLKSTVQNDEELKKLIDDNTRNWDFDRIAFMDILIMEVALAEIQNFPTIPINVSLNEYIEIAKKYSTDKSSTFINGVLDNIVNQLKKENKLIKVMVVGK